MLNMALWLAQSDVAKAAQPGGLSAGTREKLILLAVLLLVASLALILVFALRKRRPARRSRHHPAHEPAAQPVSLESESRAGLAHRRQKRRRRDHHPRNPTLAETGGLPPLRQDDATRTPSQS